MKAKTKVSTLVLAAMLFGLGPPPVQGSGLGYHYTGAYTSSRYDGAYAWIEVVNPTVRPNTLDFVVSRIMAKKLNDGDVSGQAWLEVGWAEIGWEGLVGGVPEQFVYTYDTVADEWSFYNALCVSDGCHVDVRIIPSASCDIGDPTCVWSAQLFNHSTGTWQNLRSVTLPMDRAYLEEFTEVYMDLDEPMSGHVDLDQSYNDLDWWQTQRRYADGSFVNWNSTATSVVAQAPYCSDWITNYYRFEAQEGGC